MFDALYSKAAAAVIAHLLTWIGVHDPGRTEPLTWPEVTSNLDHLADDEHNVDAITMIVAAYFEDRPEWALDTFSCESGLYPLAYNRAGPYIGIAQVFNGPWGVRDNMAAARSIFDRQGPGAWPVCGRQPA